MQFTPEQIIKENVVHKNDVGNAMDIVIRILKQKSNTHDLDKDNYYNATVLANSLNNQDWDEWTKIHLETQRHHSECFLKLTDGDLFDLIEMVVDGAVASLRRTPEKNYDIQKEKDFYMAHGFDEQSAQVLANTFMKIVKLKDLIIK
jgi:hypothetical protein